MKTIRARFKKGTAVALTAALLAGLVPAQPGAAGSVKAAGGTTKSPSVSTYATKAQLMDDTFKPGADGTATNYGKLVFGKNSSDEAQEWYILGRDCGVSGENTIIFAASPIATVQKFDSSDSNKPFASSFGVYESNPSEVYANHYGASELRVALQGMATNTNYFTTAEQGLMNATTVKTNDTNNSNVTYTTTDKLYALQGDHNNDQYLWAGTSDNTVLAMSSYWSSGDLFWLRWLTPPIAHKAFFADPGKRVGVSNVDEVHAVQPASNLNLSSVLFASAATAGSSGAIGDEAMTLRFDGTGKNIGTVTYNATTGDIKATKGSTSQPVSLVVQGNDGTKDWYYSKQIAGPETVNASAIKSALGLTSDIDLSVCKIWLEITDSTKNLTYAVNSDISSVAIIDIDTPVANTTLDTSASCATTGVSSTTPQITWTPGDTTAGYNTSYTASITLTADTGYKFVDSTTATINGNTATSVNKNTDGTLTVTYAFPATAKDKLTSITTQPGNATVKVGETATFTIVASGTDLTYQWQIDRNDGKGWVDIDGVTATSYTTSKVDISCNGFKYRCVVSNSAGSDTSNTAVLTVTEPTPTKGDYQIIDGANGKHTIGKDGTLTFRSNAPFSEFVAVLVDGVKVDPSNYDVSEGSTIVRLKQSFLDTLSKGSHTIAIQSIGGTATANFTVTETLVNAKAPVTGETSPVSCMVLALIIVGGFALLIAELRKAHRA